MQQTPQISSNFWENKSPLSLSSNDNEKFSGNSNENGDENNDSYN